MERYTFFCVKSVSVNIFLVPVVNTEAESTVAKDDTELNQVNISGELDMISNSAYVPRAAQNKDNHTH